MGRGCGSEAELHVDRPEEHVDGQSDDRQRELPMAALHRGEGRMREHHGGHDVEIQSHRDRPWSVSLGGYQRP